MALSDLGKFDDALKMYDIAIQINPSDAYTYYYKGFDIIKLKRNCI